MEKRKPIHFSEKAADRLLDVLLAASVLALAFSVMSGTQQKKAQVPGSSQYTVSQIHGLEQPSYPTYPVLAPLPEPTSSTPADTSTPSQKQKHKDRHAPKKDVQDFLQPFSDLRFNLYNS